MFMRWCVKEKRISTMKIKLFLVVVLLAFLTVTSFAQPVPSGPYSVVPSGGRLLVTWEESFLWIDLDRSGDIQGLSYWENINGEKLQNRLWPTEVSSSPLGFSDVKAWLEFAKTAKSEVKEIGDSLFVENFPYIFMGDSSIATIDALKPPLDRAYIFHGSKQDGTVRMLSVPIAKWKGEKPSIDHTPIMIGRDCKGKYFFPVGMTDIGIFQLSREMKEQLLKDGVSVATPK
jgi:hypothetical protein